MGEVRGREHVAFPPRSRFIMLPRRPRRAAHAGLALYEAVEPQQRIALEVGRVAARLGLAPLLPGNDRSEVDRAWWAAFVSTVVEPTVGAVSHLAFRVPGNPRVSALAMDARGRPLAFAKLLNSVEPELPAAANAVLSAEPTASFRVPAVLDEGRFERWRYRLLRPLPEGPHRPPPRAPQRLWALVDELHDRLDVLSRPATVPAHHVVCHADLTPRNVRVATDGSWWLFDWDNLRWGPRLADELRYWSAWFAYRARPNVERDAARVLALLRQRGSDHEIREAVDWPDQVRQTYRRIEPELHAAVAAAVTTSATSP